MIKNFSNLFKNTSKKILDMLGLVVYKKQKDKKIPLVIGDLVLKTNDTHDLSKNFLIAPEYGSNLVRLARYVEEKYGSLAILDIGANIGDTAAMLLEENAKYEIFCVEGNEIFFNLLKENLGMFENVHSYNMFLGSSEAKIKIGLDLHTGTTKIDHSETKDEIQIQTLDSFIAANAKSKNIKLVKIDTDGYDTLIIRGGMQFIYDLKPVIFFEYDQVYLKDNNENGLDTLEILRKAGYEDIIYYDNRGRFLLSAKLADTALLSELNRYITDKKGAFPYFDIAVFHSSDKDLAEKSINAERLRN